MLTDRCPRVAMAQLPTPIEPLPRLTAKLGGPQLWIKRDDQTGLATGGNKTRKLEFLVADALAKEADTLITCGSAQSNHARQTAAAAAKFGLACTLVLRGEEVQEARGNLLLNRLFGADVVWAGEQPIPERLEEVAEDLRARGRRPYVIPLGGSNPIGAVGYVVAMEEFLAQCAESAVSFDRIVFATGSGGTQAGLLAAARALCCGSRILGISVSLDAEGLRRQLAEIATATAKHLDLSLVFAPEDFEVEDRYLGGGYGVVGDLERSAIRVMAQTEGLLLDPVYTGRAFGGVLDLIKRGTFTPEERVLFWHTGGVASLFARTDLV